MMRRPVRSALTGATDCLRRADERFDRLTGDGTLWSETEEALIGDDGRSLPREAGHIAYWFAWAGYLRDAELYVPAE